MSLNTIKSDESRRLEVLRQYNILDTPPEEALEDLTALAATICEAPKAVISLHDENRQWFKATFGCDARETSRDVSFFAQALDQSGLLIIPDTREDDRFSQNPMVLAEPGIRFYAGAPLRSLEGVTLGTLCVIDHQPRQLTRQQEQALLILARQVMTHLELSRQAVKLTASERLLQTIFDSEPDCVKVIERDGAVSLMNPAGLEIMEAASWDEVKGRSVYSLVVPKQQAELENVIGRVLGGSNAKVEIEAVGFKGTKRWLEMRAAPLRDESGTVTCALSISRDITAVKAADEKLRKSEEKYRMIFQANPLPLWVYDEATLRFLAVNPAAIELYGYSAAEFLNMTLYDIRPPEDFQRLEQFQKSLRPYQKTREEWRHRKKNGEIIQVEVSSDSIVFGDRPARLSLANNITERIRAEEVVRRSEESLANAQRIAKMGNWDLDLSTRRLFWSDQIYEIFGVTKEHFDNTYEGFIALVHPEDAFLNLVGYTRSDVEAGVLNWKAMTPPEQSKLDEIALEKLASSGITNAFEKEFIRKDGKRVPVLLGAATFEYSPDEGVAFVLDLTERKKLEQQFLRAQRMESIGTLAGGIAHDLNNILAPIMMSIDLLKMKADDTESQNILKTIEITAKRGADIVRQLLSFARGVEGERLEVSPGHLVKDMEVIIKDTFPKNIRFQSAVSEDAWPVLGDPTQLHQILLNLCVNARDAMPEGGCLSVTVENCDIDEHYAAMHLEAKPGKYVNITVTDTGMGIPPDIIEKIFEPFFTTKGVGEGTGLGLSTAMGIIKSHGGFVNVYSEPGEGSSFKIYLPAMEAASGAVPETSQLPKLPRGNGETILIVDDEDSILNVTSQTLQAFGYRTLAAHDGAEAVALYAQHQAEISAVLTDMAMPVMDGPATIRALTKLNPAVKIIAASGLKGNGSNSNFGHASVQHFLAKPYTSGLLLKTLRSILHGD